MNYNTPFKIGNIEVSGRLSLGPMAGITDMTFRNICRECGADLLYTEMVSAKGLYYNNSNTEDLLKLAPEEKCTGLQLFGSEPELMGDMAMKVRDREFAFIDVNMGCPVPKVVNNGEGSALMEKPDLVYDIVKDLVKKAGKPVTVKIRKGFNEANAVEVARAAESAGASAIGVHGRLRTEYYSGHADWDCIKEVKNAVKIPVIGSGDVTNPKECLRMLEETGVDAVMIARAARGNPWIFKQCKVYLEEGILIDRPEPSEVKAMVLKHARIMMEDKGEFTSMHELRKHVAWYFAGYPNSARLRASVNAIEKYEDLVELMARY